MATEDDKVPSPSRVGYEELKSSRSSFPDLVMEPEIQHYQSGDQMSFGAIIQETELALAEGVMPQLIKAGSSGSYLARSRSGVSIHKC